MGMDFQFSYWVLILCFTYTEWHRVLRVTLRVACTLYNKYAFFSDDLLSFETLDRASPDLWPEQSALYFGIYTLFQFYQSSTHSLVK